MSFFEQIESKQTNLSKNTKQTLDLIQKDTNIHNNTNPSTNNLNSNSNNNFI